VALALAEAQQQAHDVCEVDAGVSSARESVQFTAERPTRGWEALKQTLRAALGAHQSARAATAA
jgi:hypothetical protein